MAFSTNKKQKLFTEINITPLTDIFLVLLIIMMVVAPSFQSMDNAVDVPEVNNGVNIEDAKVTISVTQDVLLSAISGAILLGIGLGIVFSVDGWTGGIDLIAIMVNRVILSLPVSKCLTIIDGMVVLSAGIANGNIETGLYSAIALYIIVKVIDAIISGFDYSKAFMIITEDRDELKEAIVNDIKRGVTILDGKGGYTNNDKSILLVVVNNKKQEVSLKKLIKKVDPSAFIIVSDVHEVLGEGFKSIAA